MTKRVALETAVALATAALQPFESGLVITESYGYGEGWFFYYQTPKWLETPDWKLALIDADPIFVSKDGKEVAQVPHGTSRVQFLNQRLDGGPDPKPDIGKFFATELRDKTIARCVEQIEGLQHLEDPTDLIIDSIDETIATLLDLIDNETFTFEWTTGSGESISSQQLSPNEARSRFFVDDGWLESYSQYGPHPTIDWIRRQRARNTAPATTEET